jgi:hypothetical protein
VFRDVVAVAELMETREARPIGLQCLRDVRADESLEEENLFLEGGAGPLQRAVRNEAVRGCPHEDTAAGGDVGPVEADSKTILCLRFPSLLVWEASVYGDADVRNDLQLIGGARSGRDAGVGKGGWVQVRPLRQAR